MFRWEAVAVATHCGSEFFCLNSMILKLQPLHLAFTNCLPSAFLSDEEPAMCTKGGRKNIFI